MTVLGSPASVVLPLLPEDVERVLPHDPRAREALRRALEAAPGRSVWSPDTLEYVVVGPWRHRPDIAHLQEIAAVRHANALVAAARERCREAGDAMLLAIELHDGRTADFYGRSGLRPIEDVITYELDARRPRPLPTGSLTFRMALPEVASDLRALLEIDHAAFPWLWQNSEEEFRVYGDASDVQLLLGFDGPEAVSYSGATLYADWGHLDRIAVLPDRQGQGEGFETLARTVEAMVALGAVRIGLSTQQDNARSQHLYEGFGFRRSPVYDYRLYGADLRPADDSGDPGPVPGTPRGARADGS